MTGQASSLLPTGALPSGADVTSADIVNWNRSAPKHKPTIIQSAYTVYNGFKMATYVLKSLTGILPAAKAITETCAVPLAQYSGSKTAEKVATTAVNIIGACSDLPNWVIAKTLHGGAEMVTSVVPNSDRWVFRALKDVVDITGHELANYGATCAKAAIDSKLEISRQKQKQVDTKIGEFLKDNEKLVEMKQKTEEVSTKTKNAQSIVDSAMSNAKPGANKEQKSVLLSREVSQLSITDSDSDRFSNTFVTAQESKHQKNHNGHIVARMNEFVPVILAENAQALQSQTIKEATAKQALFDAFDSVDMLDRFALVFYGNEVPHADKGNPVKSMEDTSIEDWIKTIYVNNENKAQTAKNKKFAIAHGIAQDLAVVTGVDKTQQDTWMHQLIGAMDESDRRWSNDACGEVYKILTGTTTDYFAYLPHGLKKQWNGATKNIKEFLAYLNKNGVQTVGASVDGNGKVAGTVNGIPVVVLRDGKQVIPSSTSKTPTTPAASTPASESKSESNTASKSEAGSKSGSSVACSPITKPIFEPEQEQDPKPLRPRGKQQPTKSVEVSETDSSRPSKPRGKVQPTTSPDVSGVGSSKSGNQAFGNVNDGASIAGVAIKGATGYGGVGKVGTTLNTMAEIDKGYSPGITTFNVAINQFMSKNLVVEGVLAASSLYKNNVPEKVVTERVTFLKNESNTLHSQGFFEGAADLQMVAGFMQSSDKALRFVADVSANLKLTPEKLDSIYSNNQTVEAKLRAIAEQPSLPGDMKQNMIDAADTVHVFNRAIAYIRGS